VSFGEATGLERLRLLALVAGRALLDLVQGQHLDEPSKLLSIDWLRIDTALGTIGLLLTMSIHFQQCRPGSAAASPGSSDMVLFVPQVS